MKKSTNHLASQSERMANYQLPYQAKLQQLQRLTATVKQAWQAVLPELVLDNLLVIAAQGDTLTLSTHNHTVANHLTYSRHALLDTLHQYNDDFKFITQLKFRVIHLEAASTSIHQELHCQHGVTSVTKCELSDLTKQNISQLIELVTDDIKLKAVLQKFIKPN